MEITTLNNDVWKDVMQLMQETVLTYKKFKKRLYSSDVKYMFLYKQTHKIIIDSLSIVTQSICGSNTLSLQDEFTLTKNILKVLNILKLNIKFAKDDTMTCEVYWENIENIINFFNFNDDHVTFGIDVISLLKNENIQTIITSGAMINIFVVLYTVLTEISDDVFSIMAPIFTGIIIYRTYSL